MSRRTEGLLVAGLVSLAFGLRLAYVLAQRESPFFERPVLDPAYHVEWARALAQGRTFEEGPFFRAPLYPWWLALQLWLFGPGLLAPRIAQCLLGAATTLLTWALGRRAFGPKEGLLAAALAATYWVLVYFDGELLLPTLSIPLNLLALWASLSLANSPSRKRVLAAGVAWGVSALVRPNVLLLMPFLAGWLLLRARPEWGRGVARCALLALGCLAPILPITYYNTFVAGDFALISTQAGVNLWIGNNPYTDGRTAHVPGTVGSDFWATHREAAAMAEQEAGQRLMPSQISRHYAHKAWDFMLGRPGPWLSLMAKKLALFWRDGEAANNQPVRFFAFHFTPWLRFTSIGFGLLAPLALLGWALSLRRAGLFPLWGFLLVYCAGVVIFFVCSRFRAPILPVMMVFAAHGACWTLDRWRAGARRAAAGALLAFVLLAVLFGVTRGDRKLAEAAGLARLAEGYGLQGEHARARPLIERAQELAPEDFRVRLALCDHLASGTDEDLPRALREVEGLLEERPEHMGLHERAWALLLRLKRYQELIARVEAVLDQAPGFAGAHYHRGAALVGLDRFRRAVPHLERVRLLEPWGSRAPAVLGQVQRALGRLDVALPLLEEAIVNDRFENLRQIETNVYRLAIRMRLRAGDLEQARRHAAAFFARRPGDPEALALLREAGVEEP